MKNLFLSLKSKITNRRALALVLLPVVTVGLYFVYKYSKPKDIYAVDPLIVTYNGDAPPDPMFTLDDMKPGDKYERCFNVKNGSPESFAVEMTGLATQEEKNFAEILDVEIIDPSTLEVIFSGKLKDFFAAPPFDLGDFTAGSDRTFCIRVNFPPEAGNEYQLALVIFDIVWRTELPDIDIPPECEHLAKGIVDVIYGTEGPDNIHGNINGNLIYALGGNDVVDSSSSGDCVVLGAGDDEVDSESGSDVVLGGPGIDEIKTGSGNDVVWGGSEDDDIDLGSGLDVAYGEDGNDDIDGGDNDDKIHGGNGNDIIRGGSGNDRLWGDAGDDTIHAGTGNDYLDGGADFDELHGSTDTDTCVNGEDNSSCEL